MAERNETFIELRKRIYAMYIMITKAHFTDSDCEVTEKDYDSLVASLCLAKMNEEISEYEFNILGGCLIRTYEIFRLGRF